MRNGAGSTGPRRSSRSCRAGTIRGAAVCRTARAYLDVNCAHCHNPEGSASNSSLFLRWTDPVHGPIPAFTYVSGLWERATGAFPFNLGFMWEGAKAKLAPTTQMNMVSTNDIIGGNSGSPLLNRQGEVVGLAFDGNIHSLGNAYGFDPALSRAVSVASPILFEGLRKVYRANALADELQGK